MSNIILKIDESDYAETERFRFSIHDDLGNGSFTVGITDSWGSIDSNYLSITSDVLDQLIAGCQWAKRRVFEEAAKADLLPGARRTK